MMIKEQEHNAACRQESVSPHLRCSDCQNAIRRATKRGKNHYKCHGVGMTSESRNYWRNQQDVRLYQDFRWAQVSA